MKRHKICKIILAILAVFLCVAFYELIGICITYKKQPAVSDATIKETKYYECGGEREYGKSSNH